MKTNKYWIVWLLLGVVHLMPAPLRGGEPEAFAVGRFSAMTPGGMVSEWEPLVFREDFRLAFGTAPPPISGIAVMTDTDNTREAATAWYGDIVLEKSQ